MVTPLNLTEKRMKKKGMMLWMGRVKKMHIYRVSVMNAKPVTLLLTWCRAGEYKTILQLVGVLSHGKVAKRMTDRAIDLMQDVQNLRKAIYECVIYVSSRGLFLNFSGFYC
jgi:hypothetical protein